MLRGHAPRSPPRSRNLVTHGHQNLPRAPRGQAAGARAIEMASDREHSSVASR